MGKNITINICKLIDNLFKIGYNNIAGRNTLYTCETELTFKRHVMSSVTRPPYGGFLIRRCKMNIYIYSDESGVFDKVHMIFLSLVD